MAEQTADQEPSIEEILDSIRQIISDDEGGDESAPVKTEEAAPQEEIVELTEKIEEEPPPAEESMPEPEAPPPPPAEPKEKIEVALKDIDEEVSAMPEPESPAEEATPEPKPAPPPPPVNAKDSILTREAEAAAMEAFTELAKKAHVERSGSVTIEDIVRHEIRPLLKEWVDKNLPPIVERLLKKELERISKQFMED